MRRQTKRPLLCELHAHTAWSDGELSLGELVDLYGGAGFDVLCVTDHVVRAGDRCRGVGEGDFGAYLAAVDAEAERARGRYGLLVIPGVELSWNDDDLDRAAHAVAPGLRRYVGLDDGLALAIREARASGSAIIGAHPHGDDQTDAHPPATTRGFWHDRELAALVDRFEVLNQNNLYSWVASTRKPLLASGDFHRLEHFATWKTLLPCEKDERAVVEYLCSPAPAYLAAFDDEAVAARAAA